MNLPAPDLYLVRIWRGPGDFRATARRVDGEVLHCLHSPQELAAFLAEAAQDGADAELAIEPPPAGKRPGNAPA